MSIILLDQFALSTDRFTYSHGTRSFITEASDFNDRPLRLSRIYDDAADVGITLKSSKTGRFMRCYLEEERRDAEGDIQSWHFRPIAEDVRADPLLEGITVTIFND